jgi:hypothetical protein
VLPADDFEPATWPVIGKRSDRLELPIQLAFRKLMKQVAPRCRVVAVPNGTFIASRAGRRKADQEGRSAGFPDTIILWTGGFAAIEWKAGNATSCDVSNNQSEWLTWLEAAGHPCAVFREEHQAAEWLKSLGAPVTLA